LSALLLAVLVMTGVPGAADTGRMWFDDSELHVSAGAFRYEQGREVVLRGFNVSGEAKLAEYHGLPFASLADARPSEAPMRRVTGANAVRFVVTWAWVEQQPKQIDYTYLGHVAEQINAFTDVGIRVYVDFHQDLYSRYLFNKDSWYTGDGAPAWVVQA